MDGLIDRACGMMSERVSAVLGLTNEEFANCDAEEVLTQYEPGDTSMTMRMFVGTGVNEHELREWAHSSCAGVAYEAAKDGMPLQVAMESALVAALLNGWFLKQVVDRDGA